MSDGSSDAQGPTAPDDRPDATLPEDVPDWDDEYLDRVSDRLMYSFDMENGYRVRGERFDLYGELRVENQKQLLHPALNYANHEAREHLFARRADRVTVADLERLVELGHDLADEWIEADEEHFETEFTFAVVVPEVPESVREFVEGFRDRTLIKYGFYGRYEVNLVVVAPDDERLVASRNAETATAFRLWDDIDRTEPGLVERFVRSLWR
ncbi:hypothetical protein NGM10_08835 [Halorussus salilacus]|uniref:hypothetical protein n=1 Tax=Halorussus salilacus TaxID=2953750 RepID=UPI00209F5C76|nr:hypothetical protein [Halorussus salilacus]USZ66836.1 hypothetical protein NGM10_08835 [Halorussus salilacus]